jgi:hypothetical protein
MNDNLRYISLQYIKGDNYEKITCFHSEDIKIIKEILKLTYIKENYEILEKILKKDKHEIGESLLDDLINYISFKDLKGPIEEEIKKKENLLKIEKDDKIKANKDSSNKLKELTKIKKDLEAKWNELNDLEDTDDKYTTIKSELLNMLLLKNLINIYDINIDKYYDYIDSDSDNYPAINETYSYGENVLNQNDVINAYICQNIERFKTDLNKADLNKENLLKYAEEKVLYFLTILENLETDINKREKDAKKSSINDLEKLIKIFKKYLYICENNIKKYERIFDYNEIGSIDDAFMIESYSKFLKKLHKLKQNLETKDTKKIKRELINSLDQFFNLHGFNKPENIDNPDDIKYIVQRILNYT